MMALATTQPSTCPHTSCSPSRQGICVRRLTLNRARPRIVQGMALNLERQPWTNTWNTQYDCTSSGTMYSYNSKMYQTPRAGQQTQLSLNHKTVRRGHNLLTVMTMTFALQDRIPCPALKVCSMILPQTILQCMAAWYDASGRANERCPCVQ
jgi:hypothetical protein